MKTKIRNFFTKLRALHTKWRAMTPEQCAARMVALMIIMASEYSRWQQQRRARKQSKRARRAAVILQTPTRR